MSLADAIREHSARIGANPLDFATAISYETGGTFNPAIRGGAGNRHIGLIQFGIPEAAKYRVTQQTPAEAQVAAAADFLRDRGFRPGMGMAQLYSTINAGSPNRLGASDAGNGGAPGTVQQKVDQQMGAHRQKAAGLLGGTFEPPPPRPGAPAPAGSPGQAPQAGTTLGDALGAGVTLPSFGPTIIQAPSGPDPVQVAEQQQAQQRQQAAVADQERRNALVSISAFYR